MLKIQKYDEPSTPTYDRPATSEFINSPIMAETESPHLQFPQRLSIKLSASSNEVLAEPAATMIAIDKPMPAKVKTARQQRDAPPASPPCFTIIKTEIMYPIEKTMMSIKVKVIAEPIKSWLSLIFSASQISEVSSINWSCSSESHSRAGAARVYAFNLISFLTVGSGTNSLYRIVYYQSELSTPEAN